ncbi:MAG TPA: choice-of-anchor Q domain-containing protein, partial [Candidatus Methylacidiphilales bacterium]|nr:choice-of-anchor Q domain-containing protein [Candidatus Methylacidiphilales bacterium]
MLTLSIISIRYRLTHALIVWCTIWLALPFHLPIALGNPAGGNVQSGSVTINTAPGGNVTVNQRTERAVINWNSFSIKNGETTTFAQPNTRSAVLNRVTGGTTSQLDGKLNANGQVYLVNRNGVVVGKSGRISAASFTASTHDVSNAEFMNGGDLTFRGSSSASVINFGKLKATDGDVTLIARRVENHGKITARRGSVNMAGGTEILLRPGGDSANQRVFIKSSGVDGAGSVLNTGSIRAMAAELRATGGNEYALAVNNAGVIRASTVDRSGGRIVLKAEGAGSKTSGKVMNSGKLIAKARGNGKPGGSVVITGEHVTLAATSRIDVSGNAGGSGGTVNIGGGAQGKDFTIANAKTITLEQGSLINADGGTRGGSAILWSDENTNFLGTVTARGPVGGFVEVSSKGLLHFHGLVDTAGGTLLLDPASITINNGTSTSATDSILNVDELVNMLFFNDITLQATHFITVDAVIASSSPYDLKLDAPTLNLNRAISLGVGATLSGSSTIINIGASGKIQNAVHAASATTSATLNLAAATYAENIAIDKAITLTGKGDSTIINGNNSGTVFTIKPGAGKQVTFNSLAVTGGTGTFALIGTDTVVVGGGFYMISGDTAINNVTIYGNTVQDRGAGIFFNSPGTLLINNSAIRNNTSYKDAAGLYNRYGGYVRVSNTTFSNNISPSAASVAGGMLNYIDGSNAVDIINSTFTNNRANNGAGIYNYALGKSIVNITGSTFTANQSPVIGGGAILNWTEGTARINIAGSTFTGNQGQNGGGIFNYVNNSSRVTIADSIFSKNIGINNGGAIYTDIRGNASVEINNSRFTQNQAHRGGGVYVRNATGATGSEAINNSIFTGNTSTIGGGGIHTNINSITVSIQGSTFTGNSSGDRGGGIQNNSVSTARLIISNSVFTGNAATLRGGGIHNNMTGGSMAVSGSTFTNNVASDPINGGAGIHNNVSGGTVLISGSGFSGNRSAFGGGIFNTLTGTGAISISSSSFTTNTGAPSGSGGAMMNRVDGSASLIINGCTFTGNSASFGGGLFNWLYGNATMTVQDSTFQNNSTAYVNGEGGALYNYIYNSAALTIRGSTFISNTADVLGGAISNAGSFAANTGGSVMIFNSTFFGNTAVYGGAIYQTATTNSTLTIDSSTIAGNTATLGGGGLYADIVPLTLRNTIIGDNIAPTDPDVYGSNSATSIVDGGHNLIENTGNITSFTGPGTITGVDPLLAPLGFYGGPVKTMALRVGSPALNAGSTTLTVDQRGFARPSGAQEDIGAYEAQPTGTYMVLNTLDFLAVPIANSLRLSTSTGYFAEVPTNVIFNIPVTDPGYNTGTGVWTIAALAGTTGFSILHSLNINAATQPGYTGTAPVIVVNGNRAGGVAASVFTVAPGAGNTVSMNALGITGGSGIFSGGGILFSNGNLNLTNSNI